MELEHFLEHWTIKSYFLEIYITSEVFLISTVGIELVV